MSTAVQYSGTQLAAGDLNEIADAFAEAGHAVRVPGRGMLQIIPPGQAAARKSLLLSVGIHGDETAPIDLAAELLAQLAATPSALRVNLFVVVGNLDAIAAGKRYLESDLNRLFLRERGEGGGREAERADAILRATDAFFAQPCAARWHIDLHTAIRASHFHTFAIVPDVFGDAGRAQLIDWLGAAAFDAAVLNRKLAGTYSAYSAQQHGAIACTAELGRVGTLGANDLGPLRAAQAALASLLQGMPLPAGTPPRLFRVAQELVKYGAGFRFAFDAAINFTPVPPGSLIAEDGETRWLTGTRTEYAVFPNPDVAVGKRAGLMVTDVPQATDTDRP